MRSRDRIKGLKVEQLTPALLHNFSHQPVRQCDVDEWVIGSGGRPLKEGIKRLARRLEDDIVTHARALLRESDGAVLVIWGSTYIRPGLSSVWLSASEEAEPLALGLHVLLKEGFKELLDDSEESLVAISLSYNELHHKWLRWLGFTNEAGEDVYAPARHLIFRYTAENQHNV